MLLQKIIIIGSHEKDGINTVHNKGNLLLGRLDGDDDDAEPSDASAGGPTDDVTQPPWGQGQPAPCNVPVWAYSGGK